MLELVRAALDSWGLADARSIAVPALGTMNETWLVRHARGAVVLRRHRRRDESGVMFEHSVIDHVRRHGIPAPRVIATPGGDRLVKLHGRLYSLYSWEPGSHAERGRAGEARAYAAGQVLGRVHDALIAIGGGPPDAVAESCEDARRRMDNLEALVREKGNPSWNWVLNDLDDRREWLARSGEAPSGYGDRPQVIHGDYQLTNLLFVQDAVSAVIDWDKARVASPAMEVVRALDHGLELVPADCSAFLAGYRTVRLLPDHILSAAVLGWTHQQARSLWVLDRTLADGDERVAQFARPFRPFNQRWADARLTATAR